jgi:hypothetical protein
MLRGQKDDAIGRKSLFESAHRRRAPDYKGRFGVREDNDFADRNHGVLDDVVGSSIVEFLHCDYFPNSLSFCAIM